MLFLRDTVVFNCIIALITLVSVYEILVATHYVKNRVLIGCGLLFAAVVPCCPCRRPGEGLWRAEAGTSLRSAADGNAAFSLVSAYLPP